MSKVVVGTGTGKYTSTVKKIANGETGNQATFNAPIIDLENRTMALRTAVDSTDSVVTSVESSLAAFKTSHSHDGSADNGGKIDLEKAYSNGGAVNIIGVQQDGSINIKTNAVEAHPSSFSILDHSGTGTEGVKLFSVTDNNTSATIEVGLPSATSEFKINDSSNAVICRVDNTGNLTAKAFTVNDGTTDLLKVTTTDVVVKKPVKLLNGATEVFTVDIDGKVATPEVKINAGAVQKLKLDSTGLLLNEVPLTLVDSNATPNTLFSVANTGDLVAKSLEAKSGAVEIIKADATNGVVLKKGATFKNSSNATTATINTDGEVLAKSVTVNDGTTNVASVSSTGVVTAKTVTVNNGTVDVLKADANSIEFKKEIKTIEGSNTVFNVTDAGALSARDISVKNSAGQIRFSVDNNGNLELKNTSGEILFKVDGSGNITATQIILGAAAEFKILASDGTTELFKVDQNRVYAKDIQGL